MAGAILIMSGPVGHDQEHLSDVDRPAEVAGVLLIMR